MRQRLESWGGNPRVRAYRLTSDPWQEDPACYLTDQEIGISGENHQLETTSYSKNNIPIKNITLPS